MCDVVSLLHSMESFPGVASRVLKEFRTLLQHGPSPLGFTNLLQIITINMFAIYNVHSRGKFAYLFSKICCRNLNSDNFAKF